MKRKLFTAVCFLLAAAMLPSGASAAGAGKGSKKEVGIQLYSVRSLIGVFGKSEGDYKPVLQALADMGYTFVEAASYKDGLLYGTLPQQFRRDVEATGMKVLSTHCTLNLSDKQLATGDFTEALKWWDECIAAHKAAGVEYIVVPSMRRIETLDGLATYCRYFNEVGARCKAAGIKFGYHNHSREFEKVEDRVMLDYMLENTDPDKVFFQMDVYWTVMGQASPVDYFTKYPGRFRLLHIKDRREVGQSGMVGYDAIFCNAATAGVENIIVEMEGSSYGDVLRSVREEILDNGAEIAAAIRKAKGFAIVEENKLKRVPTGFPADSEYAEMLKLKDFYIAKKITEEFLLSEDLLERTLAEFRRTQPFIAILNRAVQFAYEEMM